MGRKEMIFLHDGIKYITIRNTGNSDNYLALALSDKPCEIEFLPLDLNSTNPSITKNNIKKQVYEGVIHMQKNTRKKVNIKKIYYLQSDSYTDSIYKLMIIELLSRIINHERFIEINSDPYIKNKGLRKQNHQKQ